MSTIEFVELVVGLCLLTILLLFCYIWARRHVIAGSCPLVLCALKTPAAPAWRLGLLRFGDASIDWFPIVALTTRPRESWARHLVHMGAPTRAAEPVPGLGEATTVRASVPGRDFELAMAASGATAMRAWLESAPPGYGASPGTYA